MKWTFKLQQLPYGSCPGPCVVGAVQNLEWIRRSSITGYPERQHSYLGVETPV